MCLGGLGGDLETPLLGKHGPDHWVKGVGLLTSYVSCVHLPTPGPLGGV